MSFLNLIIAIRKWACLKKKAFQRKRTSPATQESCSSPLSVPDVKIVRRLEWVIFL
jgi:hypothetical protein